LRKLEELCGSSILTQLTSNNWLSYGILLISFVLSVMLGVSSNSEALMRLINREKNLKSITQKDSA